MIDEIVTTYKQAYRPEGRVDWNRWTSDQQERYDNQQALEKIPQLSAEQLHTILDQLPEPSYQEAATSAFVADYMLGLDYELVRDEEFKPHETELVFRVEEEPTVYIRVDTDAVSADYGIKHTCGHSLNLAAVLSVAQKLKEDGLDHVGFIFQPAEEGPGRKEDGYRHPQGFGGGQYLRAKGIYQSVPALVSVHTDTSLEPHEVRISEGEATTAAYRFNFRAEGKAAHAALPWQGENPIDKAVGFVMDVKTLNEQARTNATIDYLLVTPSEIRTPDGELNSLKQYCDVGGISRVSGLAALARFNEFMSEHAAKVELEAPPVYNDAHLATIARQVAEENGFSNDPTPARFRDETAWAGRIEQPWVEDPARYSPGCKRILHFFTSAGENTGGLHAEEFSPCVASAADAQVKMLYGIVKKLNVDDRISEG